MRLTRSKPTQEKQVLPEVKPEGQVWPLHRLGRHDNELNIIHHPGCFTVFEVSPISSHKMVTTSENGMKKGPLPYQKMSI
jgi:hypothetical protein